MITTRRLEVISSIIGIRFVQPIGPSDAMIEKIDEYSYAVGEILDLTVEERSDMGRVLKWRVRAAGHSDVVISEQELVGWYYECVIDLPAAA